MIENRTNSTDFLSFDETLNELDRLKFAVAALVQGYSRGSYERENAENAERGIKDRVDYLHDCFVHWRNK